MGMGYHDAVPRSAACAGSKYVPKDLRPKKTKAIRAKLSNAQRKAVTLKTKKQRKNFPQRKFALKA